MRKYIDIHLNEHKIDVRDIDKEESVKAGRWLIAKKL